ncbi:hypothetical protein DIPPA_70169 [Diplonema papillatum]|nr:hypothetical protein DIPPA_70169 [Diplonema papillatum]
MAEIKPRCRQLQTISRRGLMLYVIFALIILAVWAKTAVVYRVNSVTSLQDRIDSVCMDGDRTMTLPRERPVRHIHVAISIAADTGKKGIDWDSIIFDRAIPCIAGVSCTTTDIQHLHFLDPPIVGGVLTLDDAKVQSFTPPVFPSGDRTRGNLNLLVFLKSTSDTHSKNDPECFWQRRWGAVCIASRKLDLNSSADTMAVLKDVDITHAQSLFGSMLAHRYEVTVEQVRREVCFNLHGLVTSLFELPSLPLPAQVHASFEAAISILERNQTSVDSAFEALFHAQSAYNNPDLITSTYFPPDHLFAIYLPIFFPVFATCIMGIGWEMQVSRKEKKLALP